MTAAGGICPPEWEAPTAVATAPADASAPAAPAWTTSHHLRPRRSRNGVSGNFHELTPLSPLRPRGLSGGGLNAFLERVWAVGGCSAFSVR